MRPNGPTAPTGCVWTLPDGRQRYYGAEPLGHQRVLRLVAHNLPPHGAQAAIVALTPGAGSRSRRSLIDSGDLISRDGQLQLTDPLLADWIRTALPL